MVVFLANQQWNFDLAKFVAVQVCFVYLPGYALQCLLRVSYVNKLSRWFVSYATGYALSVMSYVLLLVMRQQSHVVWLYVIVAIVSIGYLCRIYRKQGIAGFGQEPWQARENTIVGIILFVAFSIAFVSYQCANMSPRLLGGEVWYFPDLVFWMRNGVAATKSYPLPELSVSGNLFWYHYFSNLELAFLSLTTGIEMSDMVSVYYYPVYLILYVGGLYVVLKEVAQRQGIVYLGLCIVLFAFSLEKLTHVFFSGKVYGTSFGCVESLAFMCYALYFFFRMTREPEKRGLLLLLSLLMFLQCAGQKGPVAAVLLAGIVSWCAFVMVKRRERKWIMFVGTMFVSVFVLVSLLFIFGGVPHAEKGSTSEISISLVYTLYHSGVFLELCQKLNDIVGSYHLARMISMVLFVCSFMLIPLLALGSVMVSGHKAAGGGKRREEKSAAAIVLGTMASVGVLLCLFISQSGHSQVYFAYPAIIATDLLACLMVSRNSRCLVLPWCACGTGMVLFCVQSYQGWVGGIERLKESARAVKQLDRGYTEYDRGLTISWEEIEGLRWIRDNTQEDALLLSNKLLAPTGFRSFYVSAYSERQCFFESYGYSNQSEALIEEKTEMIRSFYNGENGSEEALRGKGCTHAVVFKKLHDNAYPPTCQIVYENNEVIVVRL